jgi:hypothetical protein
MNDRAGNSTQAHVSPVLPGKSPQVSAALAAKLTTTIAFVFVMLVAAGCASTKITSRDELVTEKLPRPTHIWVHDFAASAADVPAESALAGQYSKHSTPQTAEHIAAGRQLGAQIASELIEQIRNMGLPAQKEMRGTTPSINDIAIRGYILSFEKGSEAERVAIGFGSGTSEMRVAVEGFQMTAHGLRKLGSGTTDSSGGKTPGAALGVAALIATHNPAGLIVSSAVKVYGEETGRSKVQGRAKQTAKEIADVLKKRFEQEGWI